MSQHQYVLLSIIVLSFSSIAKAQAQIPEPAPAVRPLSEEARRALTQDSKPLLATLTAIGASISDTASNFFKDLESSAKQTGDKIRAEIAREAAEEKRLADEEGLTVDEFRLLRNLKAGTEVKSNWQRFNARPAERPRTAADEEIPEIGFGRTHASAVRYNQELPMRIAEADAAYVEQGQQEEALVRKQTSSYLTIAGGVTNVQADKVTPEMLDQSIRSQVLQVLNSENPSIDAGLVPAFNDYLQTLPATDPQGTVASDAGFTRRELEELILSPYKDNVSFKSDANKLEANKAIPLSILNARIKAREAVIVSKTAEKAQAVKTRDVSKTDELDISIRGMQAQNNDDAEWIARINKTGGKQVALLADPASAKVEVANVEQPAQSEAEITAENNAPAVSEIKFCGQTNRELSDLIIDFQQRENVTVYDNEEWWLSFGKDPNFCNQPAPQAVYDALMKKLDEEKINTEKNQKMQQDLKPARPAVRSV